MAYEKEALAMLDTTYRLALWLTRREADARDLVQDTYLRALEARDTYRPGASMRAWLARILRNRFIDRFRHGEREVPWPDGEESNKHEAANEGQARLFGDAELARLISLVRGDIERAFRAEMNPAAVLEQKRAQLGRAGDVVCLQSQQVPMPAGVMPTAA